MAGHSRGRPNLRNVRSQIGRLDQVDVGRHPRDLDIRRNLEIEELDALGPEVREHACRRSAEHV